MNEITTDVGVIIGRFQVHNLHSEHIKLINTVLGRHKKVILFLGVSNVISRKNPLDFISRKCMIESTFGTSMIILPLLDKKSDKKWSTQIHDKVREIFLMESVTLYGSKDSFLPYYTGSWKTCELKPDVYVSGTDIRESISEDVIASSDFRAGMIYRVYNDYPTVYSTVDLVIKNSNGDLLLARKPEEESWRFVGGFVDAFDANEIMSCRREGREETGLELDNFKFICSRKINDWRYRGLTDKCIMTHLYSCTISFGSPQPADDICELKWFTFNKNIRDIMVEEHKVLFDDYLKSIK